MLDISPSRLGAIFTILLLAACGGGADAPQKQQIPLNQIVAIGENSQTVQVFQAPASAKVYISGGIDKEKFQLDVENGVLKFITSPNFEQPTDSDKNNVYEVEYVISTQSQEITQTLHVTVENRNDEPVLLTTTATVDDNDESASVELKAFDEDSADVLEFYLKQADTSKYNLDKHTGVLTFIITPDYEAQTVLEIPIGVYDRVMGSPKEYLLTVNINNVPDAPSKPDLSIAYGDGQLTLNWTKSIGATKYRLLYNPDGKGYAPYGDYFLPPDPLQHDIVYSILPSPIDWLNAAFKIEAINELDDPDQPYVFPATSNEARAAGYFKASNADANDHFGRSVALSADGRILAVGAWHEGGNGSGEIDNSIYRAGAVYIFVKDASGVWSQEAYLKATKPTAEDEFGRVIALSADGQTLAVGVPNEDSASKAINGDGHDCDTTAKNCAIDAGAVYVYKRDADAKTWTQQSYIKASNAEAGDQFGYSVALSDNGNTMAVGAWREDSISASISTDITTAGADNEALEAGAAYIFNRDASGTWEQKAYIKASNSDKNDWFGSAVALSGNGNNLAVGATHEDSPSDVMVVSGSDANVNFDAGAVYVFKYNGIAWSQQAFVKPNNTGEGDWFGEALSLSYMGDVLAVSAIHEDNAAGGINAADDKDCKSSACLNDSGAVYVFTRAGTTWTQQAYIKADNTGAGDLFGASLTLSRDGKALVVGATDEDNSALGVSASVVTDDDSRQNSGATYLYTFSVPEGKTDPEWALYNYLKAPNTDAVAMGRSVAISDNGVVAIGAHAENNSQQGLPQPGVPVTIGTSAASGAVYMY